RLAEERQHRPRQAASAGRRYLRALVRRMNPQAAQADQGCRMAERKTASDALQRLLAPPYRLQQRLCPEHHLLDRNRVHTVVVGTEAHPLAAGAEREKP